MAYFSVTYLTSLVRKFGRSFACAWSQVNFTVYQNFLGVSFLLFHQDSILILNLFLPGYAI